MEFWPKFYDNLKKTTFCQEGCPIDHGESKLMNANLTIYNLSYPNVDFNTKDHIMVLIESSQTIKIVIERLYVNSVFYFKSN